MVLPALHGTSAIFDRCKRLPMRRFKNRTVRIAFAEMTRVPLFSASLGHNFCILQQQIRQARRALLRHSALLRSDPQRLPT